MSTKHTTLKVSPLCSLMALALVAALGCFAETTAQWTTPDASQNINNTNTGNVGIGTTTPATSLDIAGNILNLGSEAGTKNRGNNTTKIARLAMPPYTTANMRFALLGGATTSTANIVALGGEVGGMAAATQIDFFTAATTNVDTGTLRMTITGAGNVGIGTGSPDTKFQIHHSSTNTNVTSPQLTDLAFAFRNTSNTNGNMSLISFQDSAGWGNAQIGAIQTDQTNHSAHLVFLTRNGAAFGERMRITNAGNVGIATASPTEKLEVTGNVKITGNISVSGNINAKYQDVAEWVESSQELEAGTVVVLDTTKSNQVIAATHAYDSRVAGVISGQPGIALGEQGVGRVLVATTGRVKVKVDAKSGPIQIGDLLVTSSREGFAMKSVPMKVGRGRIHRPGTLIGKALEPLAGGTGEILVLLSMQ
jgi:hypothetical protein